MQLTVLDVSRLKYWTGKQLGKSFSMSLRRTESGYMVVSSKAKQCVLSF